MKKVGKWPMLMLVLVFACFLSGCDDAVKSAAKVVLGVTDTIHAAADTVDAARVSGVITVSEEREAQEYFSVLNKADMAFGSCVAIVNVTNGKAADVIGCTKVFSDAVSDPALLSAVHIVNPKTQQTVAAVGQTVGGFINGLMIGLQNLQAKGK